VLSVGNMKQTFDLFASDWPGPEEETPAEEAAPMNGTIGLVQTQLRLESADLDLPERAAAFPLDPAVLRRPS
jgi:hypothetical protein